MKDAELRTGLTAKEVGQFGFAARAVGQDISIVERLMRGLSQAADDNSREGEKARATLRGMGIDFHTATGEMKPTSEILTEISEGLNKLPEGLQRDAAAMDLFKKVGVEAIPFMTELNENLRVAHEQGFGPTEEDIRRFAEYQREVTVLETKWDALVRKFKEGLVVTVTWVGKGVDWFLNNISTAGDDERQRREEEQAMQDAADIRAAGGIGAKMSISGHRQQVADMERQAPEIMKNRDATLKRIEDLRAQQQGLVGDFGILQAIAPTRDEEARAKRASEIQDQIQQLQKMLEDAEAATKRTDLRAGKEETDRIRARFFGTHDGMEKAYADAKKDVERLQKQLLEPDKPLTKAQAQDLGQQLHVAEATEARRKAALDAVAKGAEQLKDFRRQAAEFEKKGDEAELDAIGKIYYQRDQLLQQAAKVKASESEIAAIRKAADEQAAVLSKKAWEEFEKYADKQAAEQQKKMLALMMPSKEQMKEWEEGFAAQERIEDIGVQAQRDELRRRAARSARIAELTAGQETPMAMSEAEKRELVGAKGRGSGATSLPDPARSGRPVGGDRSGADIERGERGEALRAGGASAEGSVYGNRPGARPARGKAGAAPAEAPAGDPVAVRQPPEAGRKADRRSVHQAQELRQGSAEHGPRRGAQAGDRDAGRHGGERPPSDHLRRGRAGRARWCVQGR